MSSFMSNVWTISQEITIFVHFLKWSTRYEPAFGTLVHPLNWPGSPKQCNVLFLSHLDFGETVSDSLLHTYLDAALQSQFTILTASCAVNTFERRPPSSMAMYLESQEGQLRQNQYPMTCCEGRCALLK